MARRTKEAAQETKQQILAAAEEIFFLNGVSRTSLDEVATQAGVTRGAIYWHFKNKVDLFKALYESVQLPQEEIIERSVNEGAPNALKLLEKAILESFSILATDERRQRVFTILTSRCEYVGEMLEFLEHQNNANQRMRGTFVRAFELAKSEGKLAPHWPPKDAANVFMNFLFGLFTDWIRFGRGFDLRKTGGPQVKRLLASFSVDR